MIRTKNKVLGETNLPNRCISPNNLIDNGIVIINTNNELEVLEPKDSTGLITSGIYYINQDGKAAFFPTDGPNKLLSTDSNGNLCWVDI